MDEAPAHRLPCSCRDATGPTARRTPGIAHLHAAVVTVPDAGHFLYEEAPALLLAAMTEATSPRDR
ncbi:MAG: hypothetical protein IPM49_04170 [Flavobacteriales bacterium]|nr:hypothetical protein [Flavobacteriales bacterium]